MLMLLSNADVEHSQHVSCFNAAAPNGTLFSDQASKDEFLQAVKYRQLDSVVKQCEKAGRGSSFKSKSSYATAGTALQKSSSNRSSTKRQTSISAFKTLPCHECGQFGYWRDDHNSDESMKNNVESLNSSDEFFTSLEGARRAVSNTNTIFNGNKKMFPSIWRHCPRIIQFQCFL